MSAPAKLLEPDREFIRQRYLDLVDTHPDFSADELGQMAWEDGVEKALREWLAAQPAHNAPARIRDTAVWIVAC